MNQTKRDARRKAESSKHKFKNTKLTEKRETIPRKASTAKSSRQTFQHAFKNKSLKEERHLSNKKQTNQIARNKFLLESPSNLQGNERTRHEEELKENRNIVIKTNCNTTFSNCFSLTFSKHQICVILQANTLEIYKDILKKLSDQNHNSIAKSLILFSLQEICRKGLNKTLKLTYNRGPSELEKSREKLDVIITDTVNEKNVTSFIQSYDNVKLNKKDGNHFYCSI